MKETYRKTYRMEGNFCPVCAQKIEDKLKVSQGVKECSMDYVNKTLSLDSDMQMNEVEKIIRSIEPGVRLVQEDEKQTQEKGFHFKKFFNFESISLLIGIILLIVGLSTGIEYLSIAAALIAGYVIYRDGLKVLINGNGFDEKVLMSISSIGAILIGEASEGAAVIILYRIGEWLTDSAVENATKSLKSAANSKQIQARVIGTSGKTSLLSAKDVEIGQKIEVEPFEMIPLDSEVLDAFVSVDTSSFTGESEPRLYRQGEVVPAGSILLNTKAQFKVEKNANDSLINRMDHLVKLAGQNKSSQEKFLTTFSKYYTPIVVAVAIIITLYPVLVGGDINGALKKSLAFLVTACPCSVVLGVPLVYAVGLGKLSKMGILIKGSEFIDAAANKIEVIGFDKTGTITDKNLVLHDVVASDGYETEDLINLISIGEKRSTHPVSSAFSKQVDEPDDYKEIPGVGIDFVYKAEEYSIRGGGKSLEIILNKDQKTIGTFRLSEKIKDNTEVVIKNLKKLGIKTTLVSGDFEEKVAEISKELRIDDYRANFLPEDKLNYVLEIKKKQNIIFVGDGINDGAVLKAADIGVSMGKMGSDAAIESSDVVIMNDEIGKVYEFILASKKVVRRAKFVVFFSILVKLMVMGFIYYGYAKMYMAVLADVGLTLVCVLIAISLNFKNITR